MKIPFTNRELSFRRLQEATPKALDADTSQGLMRSTATVTYKPDSIDDYFTLYLDDDLVRQSVDDLVEGALGEGYYTTVDEVTPVRQRNRSKVLVDEFGEQFNLDDFLINIAKNSLIAGFCPVETLLVKGDVSKCALKIVHPKTVKDIQLNSDGSISSIIQRVSGKPPVTILGENLAWFCYGQLGNDPRGTSFIRGMVNVLNTLNTTTADVKTILEKYMSPVGIWKSRRSLEGIKKAVIEKQIGEDLFLGDLSEDEVAKGGLVEFLTIDPRIPFWEYIQFLYERVYSYTRANNLIFVRNATEASATKMDEIVGRHVVAIQRFLKRGAERYWFTPLVQLNYGESAETPRLIFGADTAAIADVQIEPFLTKGLEVQYISRTQFADLLKQMGLDLKKETGDDKPLPLLVPEKTPESPQDQPPEGVPKPEDEGEEEEPAEERVSDDGTWLVKRLRARHVAP